MRRNTMNLGAVYLYRLLAIWALLGLWVSTADCGESESLIRIGDDNKLVYRSDARGDKVPDFSYCGYQGGGIPIPEVPVKLTLFPSNDGADNTVMIQQALDKLAEAEQGPDGFRGALLLKKGSYRVSETIFIKASGIVLRGEGCGKGGTVIIATGQKQRTLIDIEGGFPVEEPLEAQRKLIKEDVRVGAVSFRVEPLHGFSVGDHVFVCRDINDEWISFVGMDKLKQGLLDPVKNWDSESFDLSYFRRITKVHDDKITIDIPIVCAIEREFGGGYVVKIAKQTSIEQVGIEQLRLVSEYEKGRENTDEEHAWDAVTIGRLCNGWVKDVVALHFGYSCVNLKKDARSITVQDCAMLDPVSRITGRRRYSFPIAGQLCLVQRCYTRNGRHDYVMHGRVPGPNVFLDCVADKTHNDCGPHHRWATGTLYDNIRCGELNAVNRGRSGTGHGWVAATTIFWNCRTDEINCDSPPGATNYSFGSTANRKIAGSGHLESNGKPMLPRSLYLQQLADRLGEQAVRAITTEEQRQGILDDFLREKFAE